MSFASQIRLTARRDLDRQLGQLTLPSAHPERGWLRAIRDALGMTAAQLGGRLGITPASVFEMERREADGSITLKTLEKAAQALNCTLVYALIPDESLETAVHRRARKVAARELEREGDMSPEEKRARLDSLIADLVGARARSLWTEG
ncbi:MAG: mobile mystery protein A [Alphaproteobacteria bacterium]